MAGHGNCVALKNRRHDITSGAGFHRHTPEFLAVNRAVTFHIGGGHVDDLVHSGELAEHEAGVRGVVVAAFPYELAGRFLQAHEAGAFVSAGRGVDVLGIGHGRAVVAVPAGGCATAPRSIATEPFGTVILGVLFAPNQLTGLQGNAGEHAGGALAKQQIAINHRCRARARAVDVGVLPRLGVGRLPKGLTGGGVDDGGCLHRVPAHHGLVTHHKAALGKNQTALPFACGHLPHLLRLGSQRIQRLFVLGESIPLFATPLRPIAGEGGLEENK